jgi:hypothetical protein
VAREPQSTGERPGWYLLLIIPFVATLFPGIYNSAAPSLGGLPYFYAYQLVWVVITALLTGFVYLVTR